MKFGICKLAILIFISVSHVNCKAVRFVLQSAIGHFGYSAI